MLPDLDDLRCFEAAAVRLNFRAAANAVSLSPAAFSERIKRLEGRVGTRLFDRTTRRVRMTPSGERLLPQARKTLAEAAACMALSGGPAPFELTLGTRFELGLSWIAPCLADLRGARPERTLHLAFASASHLLDALEAGRIDAAIGSMRLARPGLAYALLHEEEYRFVRSPESQPLSGCSDAPNHVLIDVNRELPLFRYWQDGLPADERWQFAQHEYMGTIAAIKLRVLAGAGVAVMPEYYVREELESGALIECMPNHFAKKDWFRLVWRDGHPRGADLQDLADELRTMPLR